MRSWICKSDAVCYACLWVTQTAALLLIGSGYVNTWPEQTVWYLTGGIFKGISDNVNGILFGFLLNITTDNLKALFRV